MYNFSVPSTLRAYFDHIARAGVTFRYTSAGPEGLLQGKRAYVFVTRGGLYGDGTDTQTPYLRQFLRFVGIEPHFVHAEGLAMGEEARQQSLAAARQRSRTRSIGTRSVTCSQWRFGVVLGPNLSRGDSRPELFLCKPVAIPYLFVRTPEPPSGCSRGRETNDRFPLIRLHEGYGHEHQRVGHRSFIFHCRLCPYGRLSSPGDRGASAGSALERERSRA